MRLAGKVVVVTGGASGMGASHVRCLAREGAKVAITDLAAEAAADLAAELRAAGHEVSAHRHDVANAASWQHVVAEVERRTARSASWSTTPGSRCGRPASRPTTANGTS